MYNDRIGPGGPGGQRYRCYGSGYQLLSLEGLRKLMKQQDPKLPTLRQLGDLFRNERSLSNQDLTWIAKKFADIVANSPETDISEYWSVNITKILRGCSELIKNKAPDRDLYESLDSFLNAIAESIQESPLSDCKSIVNAICSLSYMKDIDGVNTVLSAIVPGMEQQPAHFHPDDIVFALYSLSFMKHTDEVEEILKVIADIIPAQGYIFFTKQINDALCSLSKMQNSGGVNAVLNAIAVHIEAEMILCPNDIYEVLRALSENCTRDGAIQIINALVVHLREGRREDCKRFDGQLPEIFAAEILNKIIPYLNWKNEETKQAAKEAAGNVIEALRILIPFDNKDKNKGYIPINKIIFNLLGCKRKKEGDIDTFDLHGLSHDLARNSLKFLISYHWRNSNLCNNELKIIYGRATHSQVQIQDQDQDQDQDESDHIDQNKMREIAKAAMNAKNIKRYQINLNPENEGECIIKY